MSGQSTPLQEPVIFGDLIQGSVGVGITQDADGIEVGDNILTILEWYLRRFLRNNALTVFISLEKFYIGN